MRFFGATFGGDIAGVRVSEDGFIAISAGLRGNDRVDASIVVGPEGTCACKISAGDTHLACTASDARSFHQVLKDRLSAVGVRVRDRVRTDAGGYRPTVPDSPSSGMRSIVTPSAPPASPRICVTAVRSNAHR